MSTPSACRFLACLAAMVAVAPCLAADAAAERAARVERVLTATPLIDGHNDLPWEIRQRVGNADAIDLRAVAIRTAVQGLSELAEESSDIEMFVAGATRWHDYMQARPDLRL